MTLIERLTALVAHVETADKAEAPINVMHVSRELVTVAHELGQLLKALGAFDAPVAVVGEAVEGAATVAGQVLDVVNPQPNA